MTRPDHRDHGPRFEVVWHDDHDARHTFAYADTIPQAHELIRAINRHPGMRLPMILERGESDAER